MRKRGRVDANQREIIAALRKAGASVQVLSNVGDGCPDLMVRYRGQTWLMECKKGKGKLTPDQQAWIDNWNGPVHIVRSVSEALAAVGVGSGTA